MMWEYRLDAIAKTVNGNAATLTPVGPKLNERMSMADLIVWAAKGADHSKLELHGLTDDQVEFLGEPGSMFQLNLEKRTGVGYTVPSVVRA